MTAHDKDRLLVLEIARRLGVTIPEADANTLRRAACTLHRWAELECGACDDYVSWAMGVEG